MLFGPEHIEKVAPVVLGDPVWNLLKNGMYHHWEDLVAAVEEAYGLSQDQFIEGVFEMKPATGEGTH